MMILFIINTSGLYDMTIYTNKHYTIT